MSSLEKNYLCNNFYLIPMNNSVLLVKIALVFSLFSFSTQNNQKTSGIVYDNFLDPLENVIVKVGFQEVKTDADGNFSILIEEFPAVLELTKQDYDSKKVEVKTLNSRILKIVLKES